MYPLMLSHSALVRFLVGRKRDNIIALLSCQGFFLRILEIFKKLLLDIVLLDNLSVVARADERSRLALFASLYHPRRSRSPRSLSGITFSFPLSFGSSPGTWLFASR